MHPGFFAERSPDKAAVVMADNRVMSYRELEELSNKLAHLFRTIGLKSGGHIAFAVENRREFFGLMWAAQRAGLYYTACSTRLKTDELEYLVNDCGARVLVASAATLESAAAVSAPNVQLRLLLDAEADGWTPFEQALAGQPTNPLHDQAEGAYMLYSSGTTGRPKGVKVPLPKGSFPQPSRWAGIGELLGMTEATVFLTPAPLYHGAPLGFSQLVQRSGGTVVVQERFDAEEYLQLVERHRVTLTLLVPTMFVRLLRLGADVRRRYDVSSLQVAIHGAAPCPVDVKERMIEWWGPVIHEYYAGTEGIGFVHCDSHDWLTHKGTVGRSLTAPIHILGDDGEELPAGEPGAVYFESSGFEYHRDADSTSGARDPKGWGWSTMGDIGFLDEDGFLYLTDRKAYTINSGGVNIYPQEAENVLITHPMVADVAVFGIPDDEMGERVHAVVQPTDETDPSDDLAEELMRFCRERLAHYKCPRAVEFRRELPRSDTGKLFKRLLRDAYWKDRSLTN